MKYCFFLLLSIAVFYQIPAWGQNSDEPLYEEFRSFFKKPYLNLGLLIQAGAKFQYEQPDGTNGFELRNLRLKLSGKFDKSIGYAVQTTFTRSPSILDAKIFYEVSKAFILDIGIYKSPFSKEFLISTSDIDFINRAQLTLLAPNRQIGVMARGLIPSTALTYYAGVFNGNRFTTTGNDNNDLLYMARFSFNPDISGGDKKNKLELAVNIAQSNDKNVNMTGIDASYSGQRLLAGGDMRLEYNGWLISGEAVYGQFEPSDYEKFEPFGYQATLGYMFWENLQGLVRWDSYTLDNEIDAKELVIIGLNFWPTKISQLQVNYIIPTNAPVKHHQLCLMAEVSL